MLHSQQLVENDEIAVVSKLAANAAASGGAGYCAGDVNPTSGSLVVINSTFLGNDAQLGGSLYATTGCIASIQQSHFIRNTARQYGGAIVTTDYVSLSILGTNFLSNGFAASIAPPSAGGAISIGYDQFVVSKYRPKLGIFAKIKFV